MPVIRLFRSGFLLGTLFISLLVPAVTQAHSAFFELAGKKIEIKTKGKKPKFAFQSEKKQEDLNLRHDPAAEGFSLVVVGSTGRTEFISLDPALWKAKGKSTPPNSWSYKDKEGSRGGITEVQLKAGSLKVKGKGDNWGWSPEDAQGEVWVWARYEDEWYCSQFGGEIQKNEAGHFKARKADAPGACPEPTCGNAVHEGGEECDDGNTIDEDACHNDCTANPICGDGIVTSPEECDDADTDDEDGCTQECLFGECSGGFETTFDAIQSVVLEGYGCTSSICHGQADHQSDLSLYDNDADGSWAALVGVQSTAKPEWNLVEIGDIATSFAYEKLAAATYPEDFTTTSTPMPVGGALSPDHLEALELWIRGGAPRDGVVSSTAELLGECLPPPTPLKVTPPAPPGPGVGVQLRSSAWSLPAHSENEVCMATWYDFTPTNLVPEDQQFDCPGWFGPNNPSNKCFRYHKQLLLQDPQSHHSIIHVYTGDSDTSDSGWGDWTFKMNDVDDPLNGTSCDPLLIDTATGYNDGCSGEADRNAACISGYGPADWSTGLGGDGGGATAPQFSGSQESHYLQEFADGVYSVLPMSAVVVYNSHAFNLTDGDTTLAQYLNLELAAPEDQLYPAQQIFDADDIFVQNVPVFETREYCASYEIPQGGNLFWLSSHTHIRGVRWRTWLPPNEPCTVNTCVPGDPAEVDYLSTVYNDPVQMAIDPPIPYDSADPADRTILFCSLYDNGSTPDSPPVKRFSTSPPSPFLFGGPCDIEDTACANEGPNKGMVCAGEDSMCDSAPGAGDGDCDACPLTGGFTTEDEMFILLGNFYID
jgi:cysteine-rich repeat protein